MYHITSRPQICRSQFCSCNIFKEIKFHRFSPKFHISVSVYVEVIYSSVAFGQITCFPLPIPLPASQKLISIHFRKSFIISGNHVPRDPMRSFKVPLRLNSTPLSKPFPKHVWTITLHTIQTLLNKTHNSLVAKETVNILPFLRMKTCVDIHAFDENDIEVCLSFTRIHPSFGNYVYTQAHTTEIISQ
jgi:hypothetical protein